MALNKVKCYTLRLNLDNEQHRRVYEFIENLNPDIYKSKNQCLVERIDPLYDKKLGDADGTLIKNEQKLINDIKDSTEEAIIRILGNFFCGNGGKVMLASGTYSKEKKQVSTDTEKGVTNPEITDVMNRWYDD